MSIIDAAVLGIVEGITEFLPISSTGHLILAGELLRIPQTEFLKSFDISIQLGAILAVVALYFRSFFDVEIVKRLVVAFIPTGSIGFLAYPFVKSVLLGNATVVVLTLALGGAALVVFELFYREGNEITSIKAISYKQALFIGIFQALAIIPGVSRSAATIVGGLLTSGMSRKTIVEFSFLLAVPTMAAATGYDILKNAGSFSGNDFISLAVGFVTSFIVAILAIKFLLSFIRTHSFIAFGVYRIIVACIFFFVFL